MCPGEVDCSVVEEAITKQHVISNRALGVNLGRKPEDFVLSLMGPLVRNTAHPVMVDVGANVGYLSVQALKQFRQLRSFMFEPTPSTCVILLQRMIASGVADRGILSCTAATSTYSTVRIGTGNVSTGNAVSPASPSPDNASAGSFLAIPVGHSVPSNVDIVLFKTDTQGFECDVLEGSKALFTNGNHAQAIIVEVSYGMLKRTNHSVSGLLRKHMEMGYTCTTMGWHGVTARFDDRVEHGELGAPPLSERSFSPEELEQSLQKIGMTDSSGWTDVLCVPI